MIAVTPNALDLASLAAGRNRDQFARLASHMLGYRHPTEVRVDIAREWALAGWAAELESRSLMREAAALEGAL